jgi:hypothetical protein
MMVSTKVIAAIGGLVGAQFGKTNLALPWFLGAAGFLVTAIMAIFLLKEIQPVRQELSYQKDLAGLAMNGWNGIKLVLAEGELKELTTLTFLIGIASMPIFMFWSPHFLKLGGGVAGLGWIWVGIDAAILVGTLVAKEECKKRGDWRTVERGLIVSAIMIGVAGIFRNLAVGLACFFAAEVYLQLVKYGYNVRTQLVISELGFGDPAKESNLRATILSVCSMASGLGGAIGLFFGGLLAQRISIPVAWLFSSVFLVVAFLRVKNWKARQLSCGGLALSPQLVREEEQSS